MMPPRLSDRLRTARSRSFVGREAELQLLRAALEEPQHGRLFYVYGPGGVGKTALLHEYAHIADESGARTAMLDGRGIDPSPDALMLALTRSLGAPQCTTPFAVLAADRRIVILLDTYESLAPLDAWIRETLLPQLPAQTIMVLAGRTPPAIGWRLDPGMHELVCTIPLRNLDPAESRALLRNRGVPEAEHESLLRFTYGHALALSLVADVVSHAGSEAGMLAERNPHVIGVLLDRFIEHVPTPRHRVALRACALARSTTESLLRTVLGEDPRELFDWLGSLSFIERGADGLFPHDLARDVLAGDFRWRDPVGHLELLRAIADDAVARLQDARGLDQQRAFIDATYLIRDLPFVKPYYEWRKIGDCYAEAAAPADLPEILAMVRRYEGSESARIAEHWFKRNPRGFTAVRGARRKLIGFLALVELHDATPQDLELDPCARICLEYAGRHAPRRNGEEVLIQRFWMDHEAYQSASATYLVISSLLVAMYVNRPRLAWSFHPGADPEYWLPYLTFGNFHRCEETDFELGGRRYGGYVRDWRAEPAGAWLRGITDRAMHALAGADPVPRAGPEPLLVLSEPAFTEAVRQGLRDYARPGALAANPLLRSRVVVDRVGDHPTPADLRELLREAALTLRSTPRTEKFYRAIERTYLDPAPTQERAADQLGLPFNTYRYHLDRGIRLMADWLWLRELRGLEA